MVNENRQRGWRSLLPWAECTAAYREQGKPLPVRHGERASSWRRIIMMMKR